MALTLGLGLRIGGSRGGGAAGPQITGWTLDTAPDPDAVDFTCDMAATIDWLVNQTSTMTAAAIVADVAASGGDARGSYVWDGVADSDFTIDLSAVPAGDYYLHGVGRSGALVGNAVVTAFTIAATTNITAVAANGWQATYPTPPTFDPYGAPETLAVTRSGFNSAGAAVTLTDTLTLMKRLRQAYPSQASLTTDQIALSEFIYDPDTLPGSATNNSTLVYPQPVCMWLTPDLERERTSTFTAKLAVSHAYARGGRPVAAVKFIASDGTNPVEQTVSTMSSQQWATSGLYAPYFECSIDLTTLDEGLITLDVIIYPWVGAAFQASVHGSTYPSINFTVLKFLNDKAGGYGEAYAYVDPVSGDNATGVVSATPATAAASPFLTVTGARSAIVTFNTSTYSRSNSSGGTIRLVAGTHTGPLTASGIGEIPLVVEGLDPNNRTATIWQDSGTSISGGAGPGKLKVQHLTLKRTTSTSIVMFDNGATAATPDRMLVLNNVHCDINGQTTYNGWVYKTGRFWAIDCALFAGMTYSLSNVAKWVNAVGCTMGQISTGLYNMVASTSNNGPNQAVAATQLVAGEGHLVMHSKIHQPTDAECIATGAVAVGARGYHLVGSVLERKTAGSTPAFKFAADGATAAVQNIVCLGNTIVGQRTNWLYQDVGSTTIAKSGFLRNTVAQLHNCKTDVFGANANLIGNWPAAFHVGSHSIVATKGGSDGSAAGTGSWVGELRALNSLNGTGGTPIVTDWLDDQSADGGGAGNGDYTPGASSALPFIPAGFAPYPIDMMGRAVPNDGTARVGAIMAL